MVGVPPFTNTRANTDLFSKILHREAYFPNHLSQKCKSFLSGLLKKNPNERLGSKHGLTEIINHPWVSGLNFGQVMMKKIQSPIRPDPYSLNFDQEFIGVKIKNNNDVNASPESHHRSSKNIALKESARMRFANFSFYPNIDEPDDKYVDSLLQSPKSSSRTLEVQSSNQVMKDTKSEGLLQSYLAKKARNFVIFQ